MKRNIALTINGRSEAVTIDDADTLLEVLRDHFKLWSVRESCGVGACGSCTVLLDGRPASPAGAPGPGAGDPPRG